MQHAAQSMCILLPQKKQSEFISDPSPSRNPLPCSVYFSPVLPMSASHIVWEGHTYCTHINSATHTVVDYNSVSGFALTPLPTELSLESAKTFQTELLIRWNRGHLEAEHKDTQIYSHTNTSFLPYFPLINNIDISTYLKLNFLSDNELEKKSLHIKTCSHFTACCEWDPVSQAVHIHASTSSNFNSPDRLQKSSAISPTLLCGTQTNPHILNPSVSQSFPGSLRWTRIVVINLKPIWMCQRLRVLMHPGVLCVLMHWWISDTSFADIADFKYQSQKRRSKLKPP